jgi:hypothetical protein
VAANMGSGNGRRKSAFSVNRNRCEFLKYAGAGLGVLGLSTRAPGEAGPAATGRDQGRSPGGLAGNEKIRRAQPRVGAGAAAGGGLG